MPGEVEESLGFFGGISATLQFFEGLLHCWFRVQAYSSDLTSLSIRTGQGRLGCKVAQGIRDPATDFLHQYPSTRVTR